MKRRPETYIEFRAIYNQELREAGNVLMLAFKWLYEKRGPVIELSGMRSKWVRYMWTHTHRLRRLESRMHAYFDAGDPTAMQALYDLVMRDEKKG